jgi:hypothetical protein
MLRAPFRLQKKGNTGGPFEQMTSAEISDLSQSSSNGRPEVSNIRLSIRFVTSCMVALTDYKLEFAVKKLINEGWQWWILLEIGTTEEKIVFGPRLSSMD